MSRINHDRLFKELLSTFFVEFIELFFPEIIEYLEADSIEFVEKEILPTSRQERGAKRICW